MSNLIRFSNERKMSRARLMIDWFAGGKITLFEGESSSGPDVAINTQTELATFIQIPMSGGTVSSNGVFTIAAGIPPAIIQSSGIPNFARAYDSLGRVVGDFDVGIAGSGAAIIVDKNNVVSGEQISIISMSISEQ